MTLGQQELNTYIYTLFSGQFEMAENGGGAEYGDPKHSSSFSKKAPASRLAGAIPCMDAMLDESNRIPDTVTRMRALARCEEYLLRAMPVLPLLFYGFAGFQKPYVHGLSTNLLDAHPFKYVWIDTNWRPA
jgi:oligopeptide transport system substrate-binding protein